MVLEYDNSAFYYFMLSMLSIYLIPGWFYTGKYVFTAFVGGGESHRSELEKRKQAKLKTNQRGVEKLKNRTFLINVFALVAFSLLFLYLVFQVQGDSAIASFDPYMILNVDRGATDKQIKKAYKLKALEFHPDKNIGDERAASMFMMIAKAYEALTDDVARENWEKYGNPDGKQSFEFSIGLPTFLADKGNHNLILLFYLVLMVVVVPSVVWAYWRDSQMYGEGNVMYATYQTYANLLLRPDRPAVTPLRLLPELFATASEFEATLAAQPQDEAQLKVFFAHALALNGAKDAKDAAKGKDAAAAKKEAAAALVANGGTVFFEKPSKWIEAARAQRPDNYWRVLKGNLLLHAHLGRAHASERARAGGGQAAPALSAEWAKSLDYMLTTAPSLITALLAIVGDSKKFDTTLEVMKFAQCLTQGLWPNGAIAPKLRSPTHAPFFQLPHMTSDVVLALTKGGNADDGGATLKDCVAARFNAFAAKTLAAEPHLSAEEVSGLWAKLGPKDHAKLAAAADLFPGLAAAGCTGAAAADLEAVLAVLPDVAVQVRHFVHDEDFVCERDTVTLEVTLERRHVAEGAKAPSVHAPFFPLTKKAEEWWVVLKAEDERLNPWVMLVEKVVDQGRVAKKELKFPAPPRAGKHAYTVHVVSDSYLGLDHALPFELSVQPQAEVLEDDDAYDDEELETETALEATFGAGNVDSDVSDSEDEDEDKPKKGKKAEAAAAKKAEKKAAAAGKEGGKEDGDGVIVEAADAVSSDEELD